MDSWPLAGGGEAEGVQLQARLVFQGFNRGNQMGTEMQANIESLSLAHEAKHTGLAFSLSDLLKAWNENLNPNETLNITRL